jgi:hypothetical protein
MPTPQPKSETDAPSPTILLEHEHVRLRKTLTIEGRIFRAGTEGVIIFCHGTEAYQVEFPEINDFFLVYAENLEKA